MTTVKCVVRPPFEHLKNDQVVVGAVGDGGGDEAGEGSDAEVELLAGDLQDVVGEGNEAAAGPVDGDHQGHPDDGEEGVDPVVRPAPTRPEQAEVVTHFAAGHVPRRLWCPICVAGRRPNDHHRHVRDVSRVIPLLVGDC